MVKPSLFDQWNLLKVYTPRKAWNLFLLFLSFRFKKVWGLPNSFAIEPTTSCNLRCPECPSGLRSFTRNTGHLDVERVKHYIDEYSASATYLTFYFQGEPFLNPNFLDMIKYGKTKKLYIATSTKGHYLTKEKSLETVLSGLDRLIVSLDGTTQETYEQYRVGGKIEKVIEGIKNIVEAKKTLGSKTPYVIIQFLVVAPNEHQIDDVLRLGKTLKVDEVKLKTAQVYDFENGNPLIPKNKKYARYILNDTGKYQLKHEAKDECWRMWQSNVVTWDGKIVPCCFDKDAKYQMGDLNTHTLTSIWHNEKYQKFRKQLFKDRNSIDICQNCTEGATVFE